jgi:hypothetical protein
MNSSLILHCGAQEVSRDDLRLIEAPAPTNTWFPVKHSTILDAVDETLHWAGFPVLNSRLSVSRHGRQFFGVLDLQSKIGGSETLSIGIRNSNDRSFPIGFCCGTRTFVCDNLAFSAEIVISRKHTRFGESRYREGIGNAVGALPQFIANEEFRLAAMRARGLSEDEANSLILQSAERRLIGWRAIPEVLHEWRTPSHEAFQDRTAYSLLNAFTAVLKDRFQRYPLKAAYETIRLQNLLCQDGKALAC